MARTGAARGRRHGEPAARRRFEPEGDLMPVVLDTLLAGDIDAVGGVSLRLYDRLSRWKRDAGAASTGRAPASAPEPARRGDEHSGVAAEP